MPDLLPCPFCGSTALSFVLDHDDDVLVECGSCAATGPSVKTRDLAAEAWNRRVEKP